MARATRRAAVVMVSTSGRDEELKEMLEARRREIVGELKGRMRDVRTVGSEKPHEVLDPADTAEVDSQGDLEFALIQMKAETLNKIAEALSRLEAGTYGFCLECGDEIAEARLRALPFAVRCTRCEEIRESSQRRERLHLRRSAAALGLGSGW